MSTLDEVIQNAEGWNDYTSLFSEAQVAPANAPVYTDMGNGFYELKFVTGDIAFIKFHIKHDILVGSKVYPHIHWTHSGTMTAGQTVVWTIDYIYAKGHQQGASLTDTATQITLTHTADGSEVDGEHMVTECSDIQAIDAPEVDSIMLLKVTRGTGTYTGSVYGLMADLHYQMGSLSTPNKAPNFYT